VFRSLAARPRWLPALLILMAMTVSFGATMAVRLDWAEIYRKQFAKSPQMDKLPEDQREKAIQMSAKIGRVGAAVAPIVMTPIIYLIITALFWVLLKVGAGSDWSFKTAFAASLHGFAPAVPGTIVGIAVMLASDPAGSTCRTWWRPTSER